MEWLKTARTKKGLSGATVARYAQISRSAYCNIENGKRRPSVDVAKKIAGVLDFSWTRFYEEERENATRPSA